MDSPKYNRTYHLPWSPGGTDDDKIATSVESLLNKPLVVSEKMDGSNTSWEQGGCFARTHASAPSHESFDMMKALHATVKNQITVDTQLFGEWCYARHSIDYDALPGYFLLFGVRYLGDNPCWASWEEVEMWAEDINIPTVPVLWKGQVSSEKELKELTESLAYQTSVCGPTREGVVVRIAEGFDDEEFDISVMKWVRKNHVQTSEHWKNQQIVKNKLRI